MTTDMMAMGNADRAYLVGEKSSDSPGRSVYEDMTSSSNSMDEDDEQFYDDEDIAGSLPHPDEVFRERGSGGRHSRQGEFPWCTQVLAFGVVVTMVCVLVVLGLSGRESDAETVRGSGSTGAPTAAPITRDIPVVPNDGFAWRQLGSDILGSYNNDAFGYSVSISVEGERIAVSSPFFDVMTPEEHPVFLHAPKSAQNSTETSHRPAGSAQVFEYKASTNIWQRVGTEIEGIEGRERTGYGLTLSSSGHRIAVASRREDGGTELRVYEEAEIAGVAVWEQIGTPLITYRSGKLYWQSHKFVMSGSGEFVALGGNDAEIPTRAVELNHDEDNWEQMGAAIHIEHPLNTTGMFIEPSTFRHVAMSNDGLFMVVGSPRCPSIGDSVVVQGTGLVSVFNYDVKNETWRQVGDEPFLDAAGFCSVHNSGLAISGSGLRVAVAGLRGSQRYVRVFELDQSSRVWNRLGTDIELAAGVDISLSLSETGGRLAIGRAHYFEAWTKEETWSRGWVTVYEFGRATEEDTDAQADWIRLGKNIKGEERGDRIGWSVSLSGDGHRLVMGAPYNGLDAEVSSPGHVRVYQYDDLNYE